MNLESRVSALEGRVIHLESLHGMGHDGRKQQDDTKPIVLWFAGGGFESEKPILRTLAEMGILDQCQFGAQINSGKQGRANFPDRIDVRNLGIPAMHQRSVRDKPLFSEFWPTYTFWDFEPHSDRENWITRRSYDHHDIILSDSAAGDLHEVVSEHRTGEQVTLYGPTIARAWGPSDDDRRAMAGLRDMLAPWDWVFCNLYLRAPVDDHNASQHRMRIDDWIDYHKDVAEGKEVIPAITPNSETLSQQAADVYVESIMRRGLKLGVWINTSQQEKSIEGLKAIARSVAMFQGA